MDTTHLDALLNRLSSEKTRLGFAKRARNAREIKIRSVWVEQIEDEIAAEYERLGLDSVPTDVDMMTDDELLKELMA